MSEDYSPAMNVVTQTGYRWLGSTRVDLTSALTFAAAIAAGVGTTAVDDAVRAITIKPDSGVSVYYSLEGATPDNTYPLWGASGEANHPVTPEQLAVAKAIGIGGGCKATIDQYG